MLVSPAEPPAYKTLGKSSTLPEQLGADFLIFSPLLGQVGVQRKTVTDLVASIYDGRLQREIIDMKGLDVAIWILEGTPEWTSDGRLVGCRTIYTQAQHYGVTFSLLSKGFWLLATRNQADTLSCLSALENWASKTKHSSLATRPGPTTIYGSATSTDWQIHFLTGLPGMGYERAKACVNHFGGLPLSLTGDLAEVPGVGKVTAKRVKEIFS